MVKTKSLLFGSEELSFQPTEGSRAVKLVGVLLHPFHDRMLASLIIPASLVDEDFLSWV